ncbi:DUF2490 domain-containing protein [Alteromonas sp. a30]|uniref:DUF2490 domain-containing protein n=1 Tax=Alteromonas sp. a30 TaxID=2730917 RepID=UPI00227DD4E5|nr:DUF2490 domain-containing protein [Alteromonas sp. a30]MCY7295758.1 DUF2490 domain-containing protein [Alteromonas sp. a30]
MVRKKFIVLLAWNIVFWAGSSLAHSNELWVSVKKEVWDNAEVGEASNTAIYLYSEIRQREQERQIYGAFNGVVLRHNINPFLQIGAGIKYITFRSERGGFDPRFRTELEVTSSTLIGDGEPIKLSLRNRWELFKNRGKKDVNRLRHRIQLQGHLRADYGLHGWFMSHELIYTQERGAYHFQQYRFTPLGLKFKPSESVRADLFYMITRHYVGQSEDGYVHVLGLNVTF